MRQLRKLIGTQTGNTESLVIPEVLNKAAIKAIDTKLVIQKLPGFFLDNQLLTDKGDTKTYTFALEDNMAGDIVAPGAEIPESEELYTSEITLKVRKIGVRPMITTELIEDGRWDEMGRQMQRATYKMAFLIDRACGRGMTQESGAFPATGLNSARLIERAPTDAASGLTIPDDILNLVDAIEQNNGRATDIIMHPNYYRGIRATAWFAPSVERMQDGATGPVNTENGLVGTAYGLRWWSSKNLAYSGSHVLGSGLAIAWDATQAPFAFLNKRPLTLKTNYDFNRDINGFQFTQRFNVMNIQPSAVAWITGLQHKTYYREFKDRAL